MQTKTLFSFLFVVAFALQTSAQSIQKKPLDTGVYTTWKTLKNATISNDGIWISYEINPLKGDGWLYILNPQKNHTDSIPRASDAQFSTNSNFVVFKIKQPEDSIRKLKLKKKKEDELPKDSMGVYNLLTLKTTKFDNVKSFKMGKDGSDWIAFLKEEKKEKTEKTDTNSKKTDTVQIKKTDTKTNKKKDKKQTGTDLVIYNPISTKSLTQKRITEYCFSKNGEMLSMVSLKKDSIDTVKVKVFLTRTEKLDTLFQSIGLVKNIANDDDGQQLVFQYSADTAKIKQYKLYYWATRSNQCRTIIDTTEKQFPTKWTLSDNQQPDFSDDGSLIYFYTAPCQKPEPKDTLLDDEKVKLDLWSWTDGEIQSQQLKELDANKKKSWLAVYRVSDSSIVQLADSLTDRVVLLKKNLNLAMSVVNQPYEKLASWESPSYCDVYFEDVNTGRKSLVLQKQQYSFSLSPWGKYIVYYCIKDSTWNTFSIADKRFICLTKNLPVQFYEEENDNPEEPSPYGIAGWTGNDTYLLVYDKYDIWKIDPLMKEKPVNITKNGRAMNLQYRYIATDKEAVFIDTKKPMLLSVFNKVSRQSGFSSLSFKADKAVKILITDEAKFSFIAKAKNADKILYTRQTFTQYPDAIYSDLAFANRKKISNTNPQQCNYVWGTSELVHWVSYQGKKLDGLLFKPDNFDSTKTYPMIVYFYEKYADLLYNHWIPAPSRSTINPSYYCSNGYLVFMPDIEYMIGHPGKSAYDCIVSGTEFMKQKPFVAKNKIGIQGQSWGGYQVAYLITQTDIYSAAMAGAAVSDMISAYGGIRWETGISRMWQYEESQSRIGATLWEKPELYFENSPILFANQVKTPLLMMNNDNDGAVPWYQGIEYYSALRRLNKPVWMLNYNGDVHNLEKWPNRIDFSIRMKQFFDYYLKNDSMPEWMKNGIPALDKGKKLNY
ncbi:MAG: prolyl oligopeptidase family serine peptidase [Bacteroidota bacterium]